MKRSVVYCEHCETYFHIDYLVCIRPDIGVFCPFCQSDEVEDLSDREVIEILNGET